MNREGREDREDTKSGGFRFVTFEAFEDFVVRTTICLADE